MGSGKPNWNAEIKPGPLEIGFDYSFLIPATSDRVPTVYVENHRVANLDSKDPVVIDYSNRLGNGVIGLEHPELLKMQADSQHSRTIVDGISQIGFMQGGHNAYWIDEDFSLVLNAKAIEFIVNNREKPFFLYYSLPYIHVPHTPNAKFVGTTKMGPRGNGIVEMDWLTGKVIAILKTLGLLDNTIIIFSSDNGPVLDDGHADKAVELIGNHLPAGIYKGGKYSAYEGGTRVPFIVSWPNKIKADETKCIS